MATLTALSRGGRTLILMAHGNGAAPGVQAILPLSLTLTLTL